MASSPRVTAFFSGYGLRDIQRSAIAAGAANPSNPGLDTLLHIVNTESRFRAFTPAERIEIATIANQSYLLRDRYNQGQVNRRLPQETLTSLTGLHISDDKSNQFKYQILVEYRNNAGVYIVHRSINIVSRYLLTNRQLQEQIDAFAEKFVNQYSLINSQVRAGLGINYETTLLGITRYERGT